MIVFTVQISPTEDNFDGWKSWELVDEALGITPVFSSLFQAQEWCWAQASVEDTVEELEWEVLTQRIPGKQWGTMRANAAETIFQITELELDETSP